MSKILIVDDDKDISELIALILEKEDINSDVINDPIEVLKMIENGNNYDLILLDIMMPGMSGTDLCAQIRDKVTCPIVFLSAKRELVDKILGYEIGGDDYITKPFDNAELVLKIKAHLRLNKRNNINLKNGILTIGDIKLNQNTYEVYKGNVLIDLSTKEFELLKYLMENAGVVLSKEQIFEAVWKSSYGDIGTVAVNIKSLRDKLQDNNKYIITVWGDGYKFVRVDLDER